MTSSELVSGRLKLHQLKVLLAVARTGSMARAARELAISQSVVSKAIAELESLLGVRLFDRNSRGVAPTIYGHSLLKRSVVVFDELNIGVGEIGFLADPGVGELRIGTTDPQTGITCAVVRHLSKKYPRLDFKIVQAEGPTLIERELRGRRIDLMIGPSRTPSIDEDIATTFLYNNRLRVVVSPRSPWARRQRIKLSDLVKEPWCTIPSDLAGGAVFVEAFRGSGLPQPRVVISSAAGNVRRLVLEDGRFIGLSSDGTLYFDALKPRLQILPVQLPGPGFPIGILTLKHRTINPTVQLFIDCAREIVAPLAKRNWRQ